MSKVGKNNIKFLISFDNRATWRTWNGRNWEIVTTTEYPTQDLRSIFSKGLNSNDLNRLTSDMLNGIGGYRPGETTNLDILEILILPDGKTAPLRVSVYSE